MMSDDEIALVRALAANAPDEARLDRMERRIDHLDDNQREIQISLANALTVQRGVLWLGGIIGTSAIAMVLTVLTGGEL